MTTKVDDLKAQLVTKMAEMAKLRDGLRDLKGEVSSLIDDLEEAIADMDDAARAIERAADALSKQV